MRRHMALAVAMTAALGLGVFGLSALADDVAAGGEKAAPAAQQAAGAEGSGSGPTADKSVAYRTVGLALAAAAVGGVTILGASYAVARVGSAALGAMAERPELGFRAVVVVALAEGLAILGFAIAVLLSNKIV